jgi:Ner family transcriptional regulator
MHSADILAAVRKSRFRFLPAISDQFDVSEVSLRAALRRPQRRAEIAISKATGVPLHKLWPDRWSPNGERLVTRGRRSRAAA